MKKISLTGSVLAITAAAAFSMAPITTMAASNANVMCAGINACKGKSACKTATNACNGQNSCKGKGVIKTAMKNCKKQGGKVR